jgi:hypothetical protein
MYKPFGNLVFDPDGENTIIFRGQIRAMHFIASSLDIDFSRARVIMQAAPRDDDKRIVLPAKYVV